MAFDGVLLYEIKIELQERLVGGRIEKIYQPLKDELSIHIRTRRGNFKLLCSANAQDARVHLTSQQKSNPSAPPLFCMVLRKHLEGGKVIGFEQKGLERVLDINVEAYDELGNLTQRTLRLEIMGKHSNLLLLNEQGEIIDALRKYSFAVNSYREVLPGRTYVGPPAQDKLDLFQLSDEDFTQAVLQLPEQTKLAKALLQVIEGISPERAKQLVSESGLDTATTIAQAGAYEYDHLFGQLQTLRQRLSEPSGELKVNSATDAYYTGKYLDDRLRSNKANLLKLLDTELARLNNKRQIYLENLGREEEAENFKIYGDLLSAHMYMLQKGMTEVSVTNYFDPDAKLVTIPLDVSLTPSANVQKYYKRYNKLRNSINKALADLDDLESQIHYLVTIESSIDNIDSSQDLDPIKEELTSLGLIKAQRTKGKPQTTIPEPWHFKASTGEDIWVGKNNKQNDWLTLRFANADDLWFHVKDIPGSHTIVRGSGDKINDSAIVEAAQVAAYYSKARDSAQVPVDYCPVKQVRKPKGAKPGMVIYEGQRTIYVTPSQEVIHEH